MVESSAKVGLSSGLEKRNKSTSYTDYVMSGVVWVGVVWVSVGWCVSVVWYGLVWCELVWLVW